MFPRACKEFHVFLAGDKPTVPMKSPFVKPLPIHLPAESPRPINEYANDIIAAMTESHVIFSKFGNWERMSSTIPNSNMRSVPDASHFASCPNLWKQFARFMALISIKLTT